MPGTQWALDQSSDLPGPAPPGLAVPQGTVLGALFLAVTLAGRALALKAVGRPQGEQHPALDARETCEKC